MDQIVEEAAASSPQPARAPSRVLFDLSTGLKTVGFAGIPQDTRLLFYGLAGSRSIDVAGLVRPYASSFHARQRLDAIERQAAFLGLFLEGRMNRALAERALNRVHPRLALAWSLIMRGWRLSSRLEELHSGLKDAVWRGVFAPTVPPGARELLAEKKYFLSKIGNDRIIASCLAPLPTPRIDTIGFDFFFVDDVRPVRVSRGTRKIVRYHDGIPFTAPDTFSGPLPLRVHVAATRKAAVDSFFVCNSPSALDDLRMVAPRAADNATVIPYFIPRMSRQAVELGHIASIAARRISTATIDDDKKKASLATWLNSTDGAPTPRYIMSLATIEPRKNYIRLIEAWQLLRQTSKPDIKLMIVGSPGWAYQETLDAMRTHCEAGTLLHLERVAQSELPYLYSAAEVFCFPSFAEGFGIPPTEAMQCGCPVVVSRIPAHEYMAGVAALFCDPYDVPGIAAAINSALDPAMAETLRTAGLANAERFSFHELLPQWESLFERLRAENINSCTGSKG